MITLGLNQTRWIHLINPYQYAVLWQAEQEGLGISLSGEKSSPDEVPTQDLATALQLLLLSERVSLNGPDEKTERLTKYKEPIPTLDVSGLRGLGIVELLPPLGSAPGEDYGGNPWLAEVGFLDEYEPFVLAELWANGVKLPWYLLRLYVAALTGNDLRIELLEPCIPPEHKGAAEELLNLAHRERDIKNPENWDWMSLDVALALSIEQVRYAFKAAGQGAHIAGASVSAEQRLLGRDAGAIGQQIWKVLVTETVGEGLEFPVPQSLKDVARLRSLPEIRAFREFIFPFLDSAIAGDPDAFHQLRTEVLSAARHIRRLPLLRKAINWATYISLSLSAAEALSGLVGPSLATGAVAMGLERLARRWEQKGTWLYISDR